MFRPISVHYGLQQLNRKSQRFLYHLYHILVLLSDLIVILMFCLMWLCLISFFCFMWYFVLQRILFTFVWMVLYTCLALYLLVYTAVRVPTGSNFSLTNVTGYFLLIILQPVTLYFWYYLLKLHSSFKTKFLWRTFLVCQCYRPAGAPGYMENTKMAMSVFFFCPLLK